MQNNNELPNYIVEVEAKLGRPFTSAERNCAMVFAEEIKDNNNLRTGNFPNTLLACEALDAEIAASGLTFEQMYPPNNMGANQGEGV